MEFSRTDAVAAVNRMIEPPAIVRESTPQVLLDGADLDAHSVASNRRRTSYGLRTGR